jgi:3-oxoacyl-[acyl-carrier protein] reductase
MSNLSGKTALVTGASRGIGRASALALAKAGAQVLVHYSNSEKEADAVVAEIRNGGGKAEKVGADLRNPDGAHALAKRVRAVVGDRLDILVANAGISKSATIEDTTVEDFDNLFAVNVRAPFSWCSSCYRHCAREATSSSPPRSPPARQPAPCMPTPRPKAQSTRW